MRWILSFSLIIAFPLQALTLDSNKVIDVQIAKTGLTRISVEDQRIQDVFVYPQTCQNNLNLHQSGHVFVVSEGIDHPVFLTVITDRGVTQDLKLTLSANKKPGPVVLKAKPQEQKMQTSQANQISEILRSFVEGQVPEGFRFAEMQKLKRTAQEVTFTPYRSYLNGMYRVDIYSAQDCNQENKVSLNDVSRAGDLAAAFGRAASNQGNGIFLYVIKEEKKQ